MAQPSTRAGYQVALYLGSDVASPIYTFVCGLDNVEINNERGVIERAIKDCATAFAAPTMKRTPGLKMASISGSGLLATEYINDLNTAFAAGAARFWRVAVENGPAWTGKFVMSALNITANADGNSYAEISIALQSDGDTIYTASP